MKYKCRYLALCLCLCLCNSNVLRDTRKRKLQSLELDDEDSSERTVFIGNADKDFEWHHLQQNVQFYDCSAKVEHQVNNLTDWLDRML